MHKPIDRIGYHYTRLNRLTPQALEKRLGENVATGVGYHPVHGMVLIERTSERELMVLPPFWLTIDHSVSHSIVAAEKAEKGEAFVPYHMIVADAHRDLSTYPDLIRRAAISDPEEALGRVYHSSSNFLAQMVWEGLVDPTILWVLPESALRKSAWRENCLAFTDFYDVERPYPLRFCIVEEAAGFTIVGADKVMEGDKVVTLPGGGKEITLLCAFLSDLEEYVFPDGPIYWNLEGDWLGFKGRHIFEPLEDINKLFAFLNPADHPPALINFSLFYMTVPPDVEWCGFNRFLELIDPYLHKKAQEELSPDMRDLLVQQAAVSFAPPRT
ncbi:MAG: hypothetical protein HQ596_00075 [Candidatus Saganbacteria bacterium]|nr:hypothetical protein [Candidatus Saganbacteria bacterium]